MNLFSLEPEPTTTYYNSTDYDYKIPTTDTYSYNNTSYYDNTTDYNKPTTIGKFINY